MKTQLIAAEVNENFKKIDDVEFISNTTSSLVNSVFYGDVIIHFTLEEIKKGQANPKVITGEHHYKDYIDEYGFIIKEIDDDNS